MQTTLNPNTYTAQTARDTERLARIFNTAMISTRSQAGQSADDLSRKLFELMKTSEFQAILGTCQQLAVKQGISEKTAAERVIETFRQIDQIWSDYVFREGVEKLKGSPSRL
ncbi:MAG: hypothetical protein AB7P04_03465 [Bacteriovoracia bacterium]